ncbi:MAG: T9SS type A sorting domain-containing protein, partial [Cyclobacteriaceae bacterium]
TYYDYYAWRLNSSLNYVFNSESGTEIISIKAAYTFDDNAPTSFENPILMEDHVIGGMYDMRNSNKTGMVSPPDASNIVLPKGIALEIRLRTGTSYNNDNEVVVIKEYPINVTFSDNSIFNGQLQNGEMFPLIPEDILLDEESDYVINPFNSFLYAINTIEAGDSFYIGNTISSAEFMAGESILLTPGFKVLSGNSFSATVPHTEDLENTRTDGSSESFKLDGIAYLDVNYYPADLPEPDFRTLEVKYLTSRDLQQLDMDIQSEISIYPNPARENVQLQLQLVSDDELSVEFIDLEGKVQLSKKYSGLNAGEQLINVTTTSLRGGIYVVRISGKKMKRVGRLLLLD